MQNVNAISFPTARELAADLAERRMSAVEIVDDAIARIERNDETLNAVVVRDFERARDAAKAADAALERGERKPLLGVPITVKESFDVAGLPKTWGMPWFREYVSHDDAVVVARLKAAGAIVLGKTNVPFALADWQSYNDIYGTTNNPWALDRTPGGSSGGSAVSVAVGNVPIEMGSDIGGSLRAPANYCGVFSHKPSRGVIPGRGQAPPGVLGGTPDLPVVGPLARNAEDLELAFGIVEGPDVIEAAARRELPAARHRRLDAYRVLALDSHPLLPASRAMREGIARLADGLRSNGARVETSSELLPDLTALGRAFLGLLMPVIFARQPVERLAEMAQQAAAIPAEVDTPEAWSLRGAIATHRDWLIADEARVRAAYQWHAFFREFDVVIFPAMPTPAYLQDKSDFNERTIEIDGTLYPYGRQTLYASLATAAGLPATTAPMGKSDDGLPIGVQIIGPYFEDRTTLHFAKLIEDALGGFTPPPGYAK